MTLCSTSRGLPVDLVYLALILVSFFSMASLAVGCAKLGGTR
jgi:hypothetical protein